MTITGGIDYELWPAGSVETAADLGQLVVVSLFSDRRVDDGDDVPNAAQDPQNRGGWWADAFAADGDKFGSRLWLLQRGKVNDATAATAVDYAKEALQWMVDDHLCAVVDVTAERDTDRINMTVIITKSDGTKEDHQFDDLWSWLE